MWLPVLGIFNMHTNVTACDCTWVLNEHLKRVYAVRWLGKKKPLLGSQTCLSIAPVPDTQPRQLHPCPESKPLKPAMRLGQPQKHKPRSSQSHSSTSSPFTWCHRHQCLRQTCRWDQRWWLLPQTHGIHLRVQAGCTTENITNEHTMDTLNWASTEAG